MLILRILLKVALLPVVLILLLLKVIVKVGMQISSVVLGGLILFVAGCLIYTITKQAWSQTFLLVLIEDPEPFHVIRRTNQGEALVNVNIFDSKEMYRKWLRSHNIHSSNSPEEVDHDLYLLLGLHREEAERILSEGGEIRAYRKVL